MRLLALTILTIGVVSAAGHAQAQRYDPAYPVCLYVVSRAISPYYSCSFTTMDQCRASANGQMCSLNPFYARATAPVRRDKRHYKRQAGSRSPAPYNLYNEPYYGASQGYAPGEKEEFFRSLRRYQ
jgi:hypothetical protein